uniref:Myb/SANT-like DNA-binding domain-containing protein n=1 Tax=Gadus morhua TaxID=8049 RepID=A0A8C5CD28_GADMO
MAENVDLSFAFKWSQQHTAQFIKLRGENDELFTGVEHSASVAWGTILEKIGLQGKVTPLQAKKKWDNLKNIYKDCKYPGSGEGVGGKPTAATWPWFVLMDEVLGQRHSTNPPVLIASIHENTPGPSTAVVDQEVEDQDEEERRRPRSRKRDREEEMFQLIKEYMRLNREAEERRAQESRERMDRLFSILERLVDK